MIEHHSHKIQNAIQRELFMAQKSIKIAVAWFTNDLLFMPLVMKAESGVDVEIILNKDSINDPVSSGLDFDALVRAGGVVRWNDPQKSLMHHKFCIIDDGIVIEGSYNWTKKAEYNCEIVNIHRGEEKVVDTYMSLFAELKVKNTTLHEIEEPIPTTVVLKTSNEDVCSSDETKTNPTHFYDEFGALYQIKPQSLINAQSVQCKEYRIRTGTVSIQAEAFRGNKHINYITFPNEVKSIGNDTFRECENLFKVTLPSNLHRLPARIFAECTMLGEIIFPPTLKYIEEDAFRGCFMLNLDNVVFPKTIEKIEGYYWDDCDIAFLENEKNTWPAYKFLSKIMLDSIAFPNISEHIYGIGECMFIKSVELPNITKYIHRRAFANYQSLKHFTIPPHCELIDDEAFRASGIESIIIPENVRSVGKNAFTDCPNLRVVIFRSPLTQLDRECFKNCRSIETIQFPESFSHISQSCFEGCRSLKVIEFPNIRSIGRYAFRNCKNLSTLDFNGKLDYIEYGAFEGCSSLNKLYLPWLTKVEEGAFAKDFGNTMKDHRNYFYRVDDNKRYINRAPTHDKSYKELSRWDDAIQVCAKYESIYNRFRNLEIIDIEFETEYFRAELLMKFIQRNSRVKAYKAIQYAINHNLKWTIHNHFGYLYFTFTRI